MKPRILVPNGDARQTALARRLSALGRVDSVPDGGSYDGIVLPVPTRLIPGTDALPAAENRTELRLGPRSARIPAFSAGASGNRFRRRWIGRWTCWRTRRPPGPTPF